MAAFMVSQKLLDELAVILKNNYGVTLSKEELSVFCDKFTDFYKLFLDIKRRELKGPSSQVDLYKTTGI